MVCQRGNPGHHLRPLIPAVLFTFFLHNFAAALTSTSQGAPPPSLTDRQAAVRDRMQQLENRMLALSQILNDSEPDKAERLRDALELTGRQRLRLRMDQLLELIKSHRFSEAEQAQDQLLADLNGVLEALSGSSDVLAKRRDERQRLEDQKRRVRSLLDEQLQHLYRTRQVAQRQEGNAEGAGSPDKDVQEMLKTLEDLQRQTQQKASQLRQEMQKGAPKDQMRPGAKPLEGAIQRMQKAVERMQDHKAGDAAEEEEKAGANLQEALDKLDDALKQVRQEEQEEALAALDARFREMLEREMKVRERVQAVLEGRDAAQGLTEAIDWHHEARQQCDSTLRILMDEGTTVIVPELVRQLAGDMADVSAMLEKNEATEQTVRRLDEIIATLQEVLAAVDQQRSEKQPSEPGEQQQQQPNQDQRKPLLPNSAELKLLRSTQVRLNERSRVPADAAILKSISDRQRELARLAQQMNDRK